MEMLKGTPTAAKVNEILEGEDIKDAALWLDRVREHFNFPDPSDADEAAEFGRDFPGNPNWHFTNFIVGSDAYSFDSKFADADDVVHALELAIKVLEGAPSAMTKLQALRTVIHLTGDIHQPLHCITGYYDLSDMSHPKLLTEVLVDPKTVPEDRGGNQLFYTSSQELHALWDLGMPRLISADLDLLAANIEVRKLSDEAATQGDFHHWPELWATDSMKQGKAAYNGMVFNRAVNVPNPRHPGQTMLKIAVDLPGGTAGYKANQVPVVQSQLTKAAVHLAQLLTKIRFQ